MTLAGNRDLRPLSIMFTLEKPKTGVRFVLQEVSVIQYRLYIAFKNDFGNDNTQ